MEWIINFIGYFLIFCAVDINRTEESKIVLFSKDWVKVMILVTLGGLLLVN